MFSMKLPIGFTCMSGFIAMVTLDSRLFMCLIGVIRGLHVCLLVNPELSTESIRFFPIITFLLLSSLQTLEKHIIRRWKRGFSKYSTSNFMKFNIEANKKLVNTTVFYGFPVILLIICRLLLV